MAGPGGNPFANNRHADVLNENPEDEAAKLRLVEEVKNRAKGAFTQKDMASAELLYGKAISLQESLSGKAEAALYSNRAMVRLNLNKVEDSLADANKCIAADASFVKAYHRKAQALLRLSEFDDAIAAAEIGAKLEPSNKSFPELIEKAKQDKEKEKEEKAKLRSDAQDARVVLHNASTARTPAVKKAPAAEGDEDTSMRGYKKTADGKTTSYFHTEISDEAKELIAKQGFGKPQKLDAAVADEDAKGGGSTWNKAGTYEEKGMMKWVEERLRKDCVGVGFKIPTGSQGEIVTKSVENIKGDANISVSRGKRRRLLDISFDVLYEAKLGDESSGKGRLCFSEVSAGDDDEPEVKTEVDSDTPPAVREVLNAFVKPAGQGLQPLVMKVIKDLVAEYKEK